MKRLLFSFLFTLLVSASAQAQVATTIARAIRGGPTLPATCSPATSGNKADVFVKTGGSAGVYYCSAANTWTALAGGGGGGSPGGSDTQLQYNNAGAFGGITGATTNGTFVTLTSPVFVTPALGTPASGVLTNATGLPISTGVSGLGTGVATFLATPSSANLASAVTDETGSGSLVFGTSPTFSTGVTFSSAPITISGNISSPAWTTSGIRIKGVAATLTDTTSSGTVAAAYTNVYGGNTIAASSSTTFTDYYTTFMTQPTAGTNVTFTRRWVLGLNGSVQIASAARTGTPARMFQIVTPADTSLTASTESIGSQFGGDTSAATVTRQWATGALTTQRENVFVAPTYAFTGASTLTDAATVAITGAPVAGTNATITRSHALFIQGGALTMANDNAIRGRTTTGTTIDIAKVNSSNTLFFGSTSSSQQVDFNGGSIRLISANIVGASMSQPDVPNSRISFSIGSGNSVTTDTLNVSDRASSNNTTVVFRAASSQASSSKIFRIMATDGTTEKYGVAADGYVITYNGAATAGIGTTPIYASVASTGQSASISATNLQVGGAVAPSGLYKVTYYVVATTAGTSGTLDVTIAWNDGTAARSDANTSAITFGSTAYATKSVIIRADGTNNITYATTVNSPVGSPVYAIYLVLERLA